MSMTRKGSNPNPPKKAKPKPPPNPPPPKYCKNCGFCGCSGGWSCPGAY